MKHWPAVTQQVRRVARTDLKQAVFRGLALNHHAVLPLNALDGAPAHRMYVYCCLELSQLYSGAVQLQMPIYEH